MSPSENEWHQVWNKQIGLPQNKQTRVKIDLKLVHRGFVTDRRLDTGNFNLKSVVLWIVMRKPYDKKMRAWHSLSVVIQPTLESENQRPIRILGLANASS